jgi:hypothetical protein
VLVAGLLLIGAMAHEEGAFDRAAAAASRLARGSAALLLVLLALVAVVTTVLNLDMSVTFLTPVQLLATRRGGAAEEPFLLGSLFMAEAASLLLPGPNLTNLTNCCSSPRAHLGRHLRGPGVSGLAGHNRGDGGVRAVRGPPGARRAPAVDAPVPASDWGRGGLGTTASLAAAAVIVLPSAALPVATIGVAATGRLTQRQLTPAGIRASVDVAVLACVIGLASARATMTGSWSRPDRLVTEVLGMGIARTGALTRVSKIGVLPVPLPITAALLAVQLFAPNDL